MTGNGTPGGSYRASPKSVAVIVPCYNAERTLAAALDSVLSQDCVSELVVVDDGSTDGSLTLARTFEPRAKVLTGPNQGASAARNTGIRETSAAWLLFLDADDLLLPGTLAKRLETAAATSGDVIVCDWQDLADHGDHTGEGPIKSVDMAALASDAEVACATHLWAPPAALMYRRTLVEKIGGFREDLSVIQDARFLFDAAYHGARFAHSAHVGARYRVLPHSLSRRDPARFWRDVFLNGKQIEALWYARGALSTKKRGALAGIFNGAARGLFVASHPEYFEVVACQRRLGNRMPLHPRIAAPLARAVGLRQARRLLRVIGR